ncbi:glutathione S-transferase family protein [Pelagibacterium montanilacus]|uniref:glutathione S-transferase family protein n=1 Tax=Pelagibacterium montanilacus TaxID=2185280 RepID=UPI0013E09C2D|nr:glutathione S-transferase family protein [Pelagibacterium montanilacus]
MSNPELVVWGRESSVNVQKVLWVLEEMGIAYERRDAGGKYGKVDTDHFAAMNPNRLVPVIEHEGLVLWESHAIVRYVCARFGQAGLWPEDPVDRALVDQWTDWTGSTFQPAWLKLFILLVRTPSSKRDPQAVIEAQAAATRCVVKLEDRLTQTPYLAGETLSYADIVAGSSLYRWFTMDMERPPMPALETWYARLRERPAFEKTVCVSYEELRAVE